jgi:single-stranded DNA-specific DHH superfamily exonuclease
MVKPNYNFKNKDLKFIADVIFNTLNNIDNNVIALNLFKKNVLSKRGNSIEYYKSLIYFSNY